jgi:hypothetical protein
VGAALKVPVRDELQCHLSEIDKPVFSALRSVEARARIRKRCLNNNLRDAARTLKRRKRDLPVSVDRLPALHGDHALFAKGATLRDVTEGHDVRQKTQIP